MEKYLHVLQERKVDGVLELALLVVHVGIHRRLAIADELLEQAQLLKESQDAGAHGNGGA